MGTAEDGIEVALANTGNAIVEGLKHVSRSTFIERFAEAATPQVTEYLNDVCKIIAAEFGGGK